MNGSISFGGHVLRSKIGIEINRNFVGGKFAAALVHIRRCAQHNSALIAAHLQTAACYLNRQTIRAFRWGKIHVHLALQHDERFLSAVGDAYSMPLALREEKRYRFRRRSVASLTIKREITRGHLDRFARGTCRWIRAGNVDLHISLATDGAGLGLIATLARMDVVIAI